MWLVQRIIRKSYNTYDDLRDESNDDGAKSWRCVSPLYLTIPFAIMVAVFHWIMLAIVGIRIYVGEFAVDTSGATRSFITSPYGVFQCLPAYSLLGHLHHFKQILVSATIFTYQPVFYQ